jgi:antitoxin component YwqK of YwqJK toxin-antitoxin module
MSSLFFILGFLFFAQKDAVVVKSIETRFSNTAFPNGFLLKKETFDLKGNLIMATYYEPDGSNQVASVLKKSYDEKGRLLKEVQTFKDSWDLIHEYTYNNAGQVAQRLWGNNLTGKWGSELRLYNQRGDLETIEYSEKDGMLSRTAHYSYVYEAAGNITEAKRYNEDAATGEKTLNFHQKSTFNEGGKVTKTEDFAADGSRFAMTTFVYNSRGQVTEEVFFEGDVPVFKTVRTYEGNKLFQERFYENGALQHTVTHRFNNYGEPLSVRFDFVKGGFEQSTFRYTYF